MAKDHKSTVLAPLEITPEQIMAEETAELRAKVDALNNAQKSWLLGYAKWRRQELTFTRVYVVAAFWARSIATLLFALLLFAELSAAIAALVAIILAAIMFFHLVGSLDAREHKGLNFNGNSCRGYMAYVQTIFFPIMPVVHAIDWYILKRQIACGEEQVWRLKYQLADIEAHKVVPQRYADELAQARSELLGDDSELRRVKNRLSNQMRGLKADVRRLEKRLKAAGENSDRIDALQSALVRAGERVDTLQEAIDKHDEIMVKTQAILDECESYVTNALPAKLEDEELIRECDAREVGEQQAIGQAREAQERHVALLRDRVMQLAAVLSTPSNELPSANPDGDMRSTYKRLDEMAEKLAELEVAKIPT